ncbi:MAG: hypothetical protein PUC72_05555 [Bacteroidales bacterium]|nr:hypothetical protein [Bacteroidales bacterium]
MGKDYFDSLYRMAEEYNRIVSPLTEQLRIQDRWNTITSPIQRVAEMNQTILAGVTAFDTSLAQQLSLLTEPYQTMLDDMMATENMLGSQFLELAKPQIYISGLSSGYGIFDIVTQIESKTKGTSVVASVADQTSPVLNPWKIDLGLVASFDTNINNNYFSRLVSAEKTVAGLSDVLAQYDQITSISLQLASISQMGLSATWRNAITPPKLVQGLSDFAIDQYEKIQKVTDSQSIAWRLGMVEVASRFVDDQIKWGTILAVDTDEEAPKSEMIVPDFSEFPEIFAPAKRDNKNIEEAFDNSQLLVITEMGKIIIQKAKVVNLFCRAKQIPLLFPERDLLDWAMILMGSFFRDGEMLNEVLDTLNDMFDRKTIVDLIGKRGCYTEIESYRRTKETKKRLITRIQKRVYCYIISLEDELIKHFEGTCVSLFDEDIVSAHVMKALLNVQKVSMYKGVKENSINDEIRNQLSMVYEVRDQTRQGDSESGTDAGEVDMLLCDNGNPAVILEGLKLENFKRDYLDRHINKALYNYDPNGCSLVYLLIYAKAIDFGDFWDKVKKHMTGYSFPFETKEEIREISTAYTDLRHAKAVLNRNGKSVKFHLYAIQMR